MIASDPSSRSCCFLPSFLEIRPKNDRGGLASDQVEETISCWGHAVQNPLQTQRWKTCERYCALTRVASKMYLRFSWEGRIQHYWHEPHGRYGQYRRLRSLDGALNPPAVAVSCHPIGRVISDYASRGAHLGGHRTLASSPN
jgi:hypothetical protein